MVHENTGIAENNCGKHALNHAVSAWRGEYTSMSKSTTKSDAYRTIFVDVSGLLTMDDLMADGRPRQKDCYDPPARANPTWGAGGAGPIAEERNR